MFYLFPFSSIIFGIFANNPQTNLVNLPKALCCNTITNLNIFLVIFGKKPLVYFEKCRIIELNYY